MEGNGCRKNLEKSKIVSDLLNYAKLSKKKFDQKLIEDYNEKINKTKIVNNSIREEKIRIQNDYNILVQEKILKEKAMLHRLECPELFEDLVNELEKYTQLEKVYTNLLKKNIKIDKYKECSQKYKEWQQTLSVEENNSYLSSLLGIPIEPLTGSHEIKISIALTNDADMEVSCHVWLTVEDDDSEDDSKETGIDDTEGCQKTLCEKFFSSGKYRVNKTEPAIDSDTLVEIVTRFNSEDNFFNFLRDIRNQFKIMI